MPSWSIPILTLLQILVVGLILWGMFKRKRAKERHEEHVRNTGTPATALVLDATDTGDHDENSSLLHIMLRLQVTPSIGAPFETTLKSKISPIRIADFTEGKEIAVRVEPQTQFVVIAQRVQ